LSFAALDFGKRDKDGHLFPTTNVSIVSIGQITAQQRERKRMATELVAGSSQFRLMPLYAQSSEQHRTGIAGELFQLTTQGRGALAVSNISDRQPRGDDAKPRIESSELAQKRLEGRLTQPSFLWTRRILERLQAVQNQ
jgi:hypothetical protein